MPTSLEKLFIYPLPMLLLVIEMVELVVKVPEKLKERMSKMSWIDWPSVAVKAISERLEDIEELEIRRKVAEISEIAGDDDREVKASLAKEVVRSTEEVLKELKSGKRKPVTLEEFNKWCDEL
jgi:hypothetical protein